MVIFPNQCSFEEEIQKVPLLQKEALLAIQEVMLDVRIGKNIEGYKAEQVVHRMVDSIFRNQHALAGLTRRKDYDEYTIVHSINVCVLALSFGRHLQLDRETLQKLGVAALLHDVGKMKVSPAVLSKSGSLTDLEFAEIKKHPLWGEELLEKATGVPEEARWVALQHHERDHGKGYPHGLEEDQAHFLSRITAMIDVYDAVTTNRCYRPAISAYDGVRELYRLAQTDFPAPLVEHFIQFMGIYPVGTVVELDSAEIGIVVSTSAPIPLRPKVMLLFSSGRKRYSGAITVDLTERTADGNRFRWTIVRAVDPREWNVDVEFFLEKAERTIYFR